MALLIGCKKIVTVGWDLTTGTHSYNHDTLNYTVMSGEEQKTIDSIKGTSSLYDWSIKNNIDIKILSSINSADVRFTRINSIEEI